MQPKKKYFFYFTIALSIMIIFILAYLILSKEAFRFVEKKIIPEEKKNIEIERIANTEPEEGTESSLMTSSQKQTGQSSPGDSGAGKKDLPNDVPNAQICPSALDVEYLIDYMGTTTAADDDVYIGVRNNNQLPEYLNIKVDDYNEGDMQIKGLGLSIKKSITITNWWRVLNIATERTFDLLMTPKSCQAISDTITVTFPPSEGDYLD